MFSPDGRISRKRRELERRLGRSEGVLIQEAHSIVADLELFPPSHLHAASFGDCGAEEASSLWGGVVSAVGKSLVGRAVRMRSVEIIHGRR